MQRTFFVQSILKILMFQQQCNATITSATFIISRLKHIYHSVCDISLAITMRQLNVIMVLYIHVPGDFYVCYTKELHWPGPVPNSKVFPKKVPTLANMGKIASFGLINKYWVQNRKENYLRWPLIKMFIKPFLIHLTQRPAWLSSPTLSKTSNWRPRIWTITRYMDSWLTELIVARVQKVLLARGGVGSQSSWFVKRCEGGWPAVARDLVFMAGDSLD